ncbi:MAG: KpsF/GutQ family sugar-phosphate isomerase [Planctomycetaceae bacterium]|nr:KpsF/GutQ family sugar-phosphate isomerase [Planctomycetaceae bacterium]
MVGAAAQRTIPFSHLEQLRVGRETIRQEAEALLNLSRKLDASFCLAVETILSCEGSVIVCGMGKAGLIGKKITATFSSTGTRSHFLHPAEAVHGDLGCLHTNDVILALSNSGETDELLSILPTVREMGVPVISITATSQSSLAMQSDVVIELGRLKEACPWGLAPSTSTTAMLAVGDALALVVSEASGFTPAGFAKFHPGGSLGQKLKPVRELMRSLDQVRVASDSLTVREVIAQSARPGRRSGAVMLLGDGGQLSGIFTDSDLARLFESRPDGGLEEQVSKVMTRNPLTVSASAVFSDIIDLLAERKISEIPVVNEDRSPVGMIDITDIISWVPAEPVDS